jgi:hypothetical protein
MKRVNIIKYITRSFASKIKSENTTPNPNLTKDKVGMDNPMGYYESTGEFPPWDKKNQKFDMSDTSVNAKNDKIKNDYLEGKDNVFQNKNADIKINQPEGNKENNIGNKNMNNNNKNNNADNRPEKVEDHPEDQFSS